MTLSDPSEHGTR